MDWFRLNYRDYERDTLALSNAAHGVYLRLIAYYMTTEKPLPADHANLAAILRMPVDELKKIMADELAPYFRARNGRLFNRRCDRELRATKLAAERRSGYAKKAANAKWNGAKRPP